MLGTGMEPFLSALGEEDAEALRQAGTVRRYGRGATLIHEGDDSGDVLVLLAGRAKVVKVAGEREVMLAVVEPGELLGEVSAIDGTLRSSTVVALEPVTALVLSEAAFRRALAEQRGVGVAVLRTVTARLRAASDRQAEYAGHDVVWRVARRLVDLCERFGEPGEDGVEVGLALTQEELAAWTASSREAVARALGVLRTLGWVETRRRRIVVHDLPALRAYTG
jgi:CRP/FNR family transcriptional regulator, cyclic AMP receptor protein